LTHTRIWFGAIKKSVTLSVCASPYQQQFSTHSHTHTSSYPHKTTAPAHLHQALWCPSWDTVPGGGGNHTHTGRAVFFSLWLFGTMLTLADREFTHSLIPKLHPHTHSHTPTHTHTHTHTHTANNKRRQPRPQAPASLVPALTSIAARKKPKEGRKKRKSFRSNHFVCAPFPSPPLSNKTSKQQSISKQQEEHHSL
jgi:hypothetical protein